MDIGTISSRYAKALFSLAKEKGLETRVYDDMKMLADSFSREPGLRVALGNPILPAEEYLYPPVPERQTHHPRAVQYRSSGKRGSESTSPEQAEGRDRQHHRILRHCTTGADRRFSPAYRELPDRCQLCDTATGYP